MSAKPGVFRLLSRVLPACAAAAFLLAPPPLQAVSLTGYGQGPADGVYLRGGLSLTGKSSTTLNRLAGQPKARFRRLDLSGSGEVALGFRNGYTSLEAALSRIELDSRNVSAVREGVTRSDIVMWGLTSNGIIDLIPEDRLSPFFGLGAGIGHAKGKFGGFSDGTMFVMLNALAGVRYSLAPGISLDARYVFRDTTDLRFSGSGTRVRMDGSQHILTLGLVYHFPGGW